MGNPHGETLFHRIAKPISSTSLSLKQYHSLYWKGPQNRSSIQTSKYHKLDFSCVGEQQQQQDSFIRMRHTSILMDIIHTRSFTCFCGVDQPCRHSYTHTHSTKTTFSKQNKNIQDHSA